MSLRVIIFTSLVCSLSRGEVYFCSKTDAVPPWIICILIYFRVWVRVWQRILWFLNNVICVTDNSMLSERKKTALKAAEIWGQDGSKHNLEGKSHSSAHGVPSCCFFQTPLSDVSHSPVRWATIMFPECCFDNLNWLLIIIKEKWILVNCCGATWYEIWFVGVSLL